MLRKVEISIENEDVYLNGKRLIGTINSFLIAEGMDITTNESNDGEMLSIVAKKKNRDEFEQQSVHQGPMTKSEYLSNSTYYDTIPTSLCTR